MTTHTSAHEEKAKLSARLHGRRKRVRLLVTLGVLNFFGPTSTALYRPAIADSFDTDTASIRITLAASFLELGLGQFLYGPCRNDSAGADHSWAVSSCSSSRRSDVRGLRCWAFPRGCA